MDTKNNQLPVEYTLAGVFYWVLLNVSPHFRSQLRFIRPLAMVNSKVLKHHGIDNVLKCQIQDIQELVDNVWFSK